MGLIWLSNVHFPFFLKQIVLQALCSCFNKKNRYLVNDTNIVLNKNTYKSPALHHLLESLFAPVSVDFHCFAVNKALPRVNLQLHFFYKTYDLTYAGPYEVLAILLKLPFNMKWKSLGRARKRNVLPLHNGNFSNFRWLVEPRGNCWKSGKQY